MRLTLFFLLLSSLAQGQKIERYYDYFWKETRSGPLYYAVLENSNSGWHREVYKIPKGNMYSNGFFEDSNAKVAVGPYQEFYDNKKLRVEGAFARGLKHGTWMRYHDNGMMADSSEWVFGKRKGVALGWSKEGIRIDSSFFDGNGTGTAVKWYEDGTLLSAGRFLQDTLMTGKWAFYRPNGKLMAHEIYEYGNKVTQQYYNEDGSGIADTTNTDREAAFSGDPRAWTKYLERHLNVPANLNNGANKGKFTVAIRFVVNTAGTLENLEPLTNHGFGLEEEVVRILTKSKNWVPARQHNRLVKAYRIQPVTFVFN